MMRYNEMRADSRAIEEKALGLIYAMDDAQADALLVKLKEMSAGKTAGSARARMFCGVTE
jgi:hypothetical protein